MFKNLISKFKKKEIEPDSGRYFPMKFKTPEGEIITINGLDFDEFDEAMGHKDWCLIFD